MEVGPAQKVRSLISRQGFLRHVGILAGGTALVQALGICVSPVLTRFFTPNDFGLLSVYTALLTVLSVIVSFRYEMALPLPDEDEKARNLLVLCLCLVIATSSILMVALLIWGRQFLGLIHAPQLIPYLWVLPLSLVGSGVYQVLNYWGTRQKQFSLIARTRMVQSLGQQGFQVLSGILGWRPDGLIFGYILGQVLGSGGLARSNRAVFKRFTLKGIKSVACEYRQFPLFTMGSSLLTTIGLQIPSILFTSLFSLEYAGYYSLAMRVLGIPSTMVGQAVAQVFYPTAARKYKDEMFNLWFEKLTMSLAFLSLLIFGFFAIEGSTLFTWVFGYKWKTAGACSEILSPWFVCSFVSSPLSMFALIANRQKQSFYITLYETFLRVIAIYAGKLYGSFYLSLALYSIAGSIISTVYICWLLHVSGTKLRKFFIKLTAPMVVAFFLFVSGAIVNRTCAATTSFTIVLFMFVVAGLWYYKHLKQISAT